MKCKVAVIGAGVIGLSSAVRIQEQLGDNVDVILYTAEKSPHTTGDVSAGFWMPYLLQNTPNEKVIKWATETKTHFLKLWRDGLASECGISLFPVIYLTRQQETMPAWSGNLPDCQKFTQKQLQIYSREHKNDYVFGYHFISFTCEPAKFLLYLERKFVSNGGKVVIKKIQSFSELKDYDLIVNCTGLNAKYLCHDDNLKAIRGQVARVAAPWQFHIIINKEDDDNYIIPNQDCVILGGTHQEDDEDTTVRKSDTDWILNGCYQMLPSLKNAEILKEEVGLRPGRTCVRLEIEKKTVAGKTITIIHNYGHGGSGVTICYGCAGEVAELAVQAVKSFKRSNL